MFSQLSVVNAGRVATLLSKETKLVASTTPAW